MSRSTEPVAAGVAAPPPTSGAAAGPTPASASRPAPETTVPTPSHAVVLPADSPAPPKRSGTEGGGRSERPVPETTSSDDSDEEARLPFERSGPRATGTAASSPDRSVAPAPGDAAPPQIPAFGPQDPHARAQRLARALVSDIVAYHPERRDRSLRAGSLRNEFRDEVLKSWEEYVTQVGDDVARDTPYFRDALNEILAKGQAIF